MTDIFKNIANFWTIVRFYYKSGNEHFLDEAMQASSSAFLLLASITIFAFSGTLTSDIVTYIILGNLLYVITNPRIDWVFGMEISEKRLPNYILPPTSVFVHQLAHGIANAWFGFLISSISLIPLLLFFINSINLEGLTILNVLVFIIVAVLGLLFRVALQMIIAFTTFVTKEVSGSVAVYMNIELFLGGTLFPLTVLAKVLPSQFLIDFLYIQPLSFVVHHPMQVLLGNYNFEQVLLVLGGMLAWTVLTWLLAILVLNQARKKGLAV